MCHRSAVFLLLFLSASLLHGDGLPDVRVMMHPLDDVPLGENESSVFILVPRLVDPAFVTVSGTVAKEGKFLLPPDKDTTITDLIRQVGGISPTNSKPRIWIVRTTPQGRKSILVPARALLVEKRREYDLFLRADDCVIIK
jgi:hypothetical protein